jgi:aerobic-type carbon monoxide dehydrogenase small subunit (CoxS/CutS family)
MSGAHTVRLHVNGRAHELAVEPRRTLADMLRHDLGYTGTHLGCEHGICGACTVLVDGSPVRSCLVFGVQADGTEVSTVEGLAGGEDLSDLQQAFSDHHALQCGFCTPGFLLLAEAYLAERGLGRLPSASGRPEGPVTEEAAAGEISEAEARDLVASNLCRCTGYQGIVEAVLATARARHAARQKEGGAGGAGEAEAPAGGSGGPTAPAGGSGGGKERL